MNLRALVPNLQPPVIQYLNDEITYSYLAGDSLGADRPLRHIGLLSDQENRQERGVFCLLAREKRRGRLHVIHASCAPAPEWFFLAKSDIHRVMRP